MLCTEAAAAQQQRSAEVATPGFSDRVHQSMAEQGSLAVPQPTRRSTQRPNTVASVSGVCCRQPCIQALRQSIFWFQRLQATNARSVFLQGGAF